LISKSVATVSGGLTSKPAVTVFSSLALKLVATVSPGFASKPLVSFFVELQNQGGGVFFGLCLKTGNFGLMIWASKSPRRFSWFVPQNQVDLGLSVAPQNRWREVGVGHMSRSNGLLRMEISLTRVSQSGLKTGGDATMCGARGTIVEVTLKAS
jgi:hypothetical protein